MKDELDLNADKLLFLRRDITDLTRHIGEVEEEIPNSRIVESLATGMSCTSAEEESFSLLRSSVDIYFKANSNYVQDWDVSDSYH